jgi:CDGSH-type Zn-finger protein
MHKDKGFKPVKVVITEKKRVAWCMCKHTGTMPFCDGSHARLA